METVKLGDGYVYIHYITLSLKMSTIKSLKYREWDRMGGGREVQEGGDKCIPRIDSCQCTAQTSQHNIVKQLSFN